MSVAFGTILCFYFSCDVDGLSNLCCIPRVLIIFPSLTLELSPSSAACRPNCFCHSVGTFIQASTMDASLLSEYMVILLLSYFLVATKPSV